MNHGRIKLFLILLVCATIVIWVAIAKFDFLNEENNIIGSKINKWLNRTTTIEDMTVDPSFFEGNNIATKTNIEVKQRDPNEISAVAYLVGNVNTGQIYLQKNINKAMPVASISKLVTAFAATDALASTTEVKIHSYDPILVPTDTSGIREGEKYTLGEALYPMLLNSSNVMAEAIASSSGSRGKFVELMSGYSWEIDMPSSYFADPSGISPMNKASPRDIFTLAQYLFKSRSDILEITRQATYIIATTTEHDYHLLKNIHPFVWDSNFLGGKTGKTNIAKETMLTILKINNQPIAIVVLGSDFGYREKDTRLLLAKVRDTVI